MNQSKINLFSDEEYFYRIIDLVPASIYWKDRQGRYLGCNQYMLDMAQMSDRAMIISKKDNELPWRKIAKELWRIDSYVMDAETVYEVEEMPVLANKQQRIFMTTKSPLYDENHKVMGVIGISVDITDKKESEKLQLEKKALEEKLRVIQTTAASMAHELRTPLRTIHTGILGVKNILSNLFTPESKKDDTEEKSLNALLSSMESETNAAFTVIDMLLIKADLSSIDMDKFKKVSMAACLEQAIKRYAFKRGERDLVHSQPINFHFYGDETLMTHVLFNLFKNSIYYIKVKGSGEINIWHTEDEQFNFLHVKDTGTGIDEPILSQIFDQFFTRTPHGTGVGLAFCKMVMQSFGGDIVCESRLGAYTEFILSFPRNFLGDQNK